MVEWYRIRPLTPVIRVALSLPRLREVSLPVAVLFRIRLAPIHLAVRLPLLRPRLELLATAAWRKTRRLHRERILPTAAWCKTRRLHRERTLPTVAWYKTRPLHRGRILPTVAWYKTRPLLRALTLRMVA